MTVTAGPAAARERAIADYPELRLCIGGQCRTSSSGESTEVLDPATEESIGQVPAATSDEVDQAIDAAATAFAGWRRLSPVDRAAILQRAAGLLTQRREQVAAIISLELGKPLAQALVEVDTAVAHLQWNAEEGRRTYGRIIPGRAQRRQLVLREPLGPIAAFAPWNAPLITPARKISSALAAGCTVVIKPAEETPGAALSLVRALEDAGLPPGVVNVVFGNPPAISGQLLADERIRGMTFTGSVEVGRALAELGGRHLKPSVMELGGHAPVVICADAATDALAAATARAAYRNAGQVCTSPTRLFVERRAYGRFVAALGDRVAALRVGSPFDPVVDVGPLATDRRLEALTMLVDDAVDHGAQLITGGVRDRGPGYYWRPALLADVPSVARISTVEPFGPIATMRPFDSLDEAVALANEVSVGLAGYVFTGDATAQQTLIDGLDCGSIAVNNWQASGSETPFGGRRDSGFGTEGGSEGVAVFQQTKYVGID